MTSRGIPAILRLAREEDRDAFDRLVREHGPAVFRMAVRITRTRPDAEDLFQETFLRAWRGIRRFRGDAGIRSWIYRILLNTSRTRPRPRPEPLDLAARTSADADPAQATARRDLLARVLEAVDTLPRRQREAMLLRARGGLSYAEIAEIMRIARVAVKSHLVLARRKLLARFGGEIEELGIPCE